jgi:hypothetical protein
MVGFTKEDLNMQASHSKDLETRQKKRMPSAEKTTIPNPIIQFDNGSKPIHMHYHHWPMQNITKTMEGQIWQLPLRLAWALTIHHVQGMTLKKAKLRTREIIKYSQGYVGFSHVKTLNRLFLHNLDPSSIQANPHIMIFHKSGYQAQYKGNVDKALQARPRPLSMIGKIMAASHYTRTVRRAQKATQGATATTQRRRKIGDLV